MGESNALGAWGEEKAARFLMDQGYHIIQRNYHSRYGEIDLIAEDEEYLIFVEVKLRRSVSHGLPEEAVTPGKQEKLRLTAQRYLQIHETNKQPRFDVVALYAKDGMDTCPLPVRHIKNAF